MTNSVSAKPISLWLGCLLAVIGGVLSSCAFVPLDWGGCIWIGLFPLFSALWSGGARGKWCCAFYGWLYGVFLFGISVWWVNEVSTLGYIPLVTCYCAVFPAIWAMVMGTWLRPQKSELPEVTLPTPERREKWRAWALADMWPSAKTALAGACLWVCLEWVRGALIPGFSWNCFGVALYGNPISQMAEFIGVIALGGIPVCFSVWLWCAARRAATMLLNEGRRTVPWDFFCFVVVVLLMFVYGVHLSVKYSESSEVVSGRDGRQVLPILAVQLNLSIKEKWDPRNTLSIYKGLIQETEKGFYDVEKKSLELAVVSGKEVSMSYPTWVIWPESSFPDATCYFANSKKVIPGQNNVHFMSKNADWVQGLRERVGDFVLITGTDEKHLSPQLKIQSVYNNLSVFTGDYESVISQPKGQLVPFGEYIPFRETLPILEDAFAFSAGMAMGCNFTPGTSTLPLSVPMQVGGDKMVSIIPLVCFEDVIGSWARKFARSESQVIVNVTNDGWFNQSWANEQHWRNAAFRAIELRRSMVRAANTGVTVAVAPNGSVINDLRNEQGNPFIRGAMYAQLPIAYTGVTLYALLGDWAVLVALCIFVFIVLTKFFKSRGTTAQVCDGVWKKAPGNNVSK